MKQKKSTLDVSKRPLVFSHEAEALEWLIVHHPEFFKDSETRNIASMVILEIGEELRMLSRLERVTVISTVVAMMFQMGKAALQTIRDQQKRSMGEIFLDTYPKQTKTDDGDNRS